MKKIVLFLVLVSTFAVNAHATLYRYKKITDAYTTHYAVQPESDETWYEHCTLDDGYTYVTTQATPPNQPAIIEWEQLSPPAQFYQVVKNASVHVDLMERRVAAGKYMRTDKHIVVGDAATVAAWKQEVLSMFGLGN